jgi:hypothetical protein
MRLIVSLAAIAWTAQGVLAQGLFCQERDELARLDESFSTRVALYNEYAILGGYLENLRIVNIADPRNPVEVSMIALPGFPMGVVVQGDIAYIAAYDAGLVTVDISDPTFPVILGVYDTTNFAQDVAVVGSYAFIAWGLNGLVVVDIQDPANPQFAAQLDTNVFAFQITIVDNIAYMASGNAVRIFDVSDPVNPQHIGDADVGGDQRAITVSGNRMFVSDWDNNGIFCFDVTDPTNPVLLGQTTALRTDFMRVVGDQLYLTSRVFGVIDISDPSNMSFDYWYNYSGNGFLVRDSLVYLCSGLDGFRIVEPNEEHFAVRSIYNTGDSVEHVLIKDQYAFVANLRDPAQVYEISDPQNPVHVADLPVSGYRLDVVGDRLYAASPSSGLGIVDISDITQPVLVNQFTQSGDLSDVRFKDGIAMAITTNREFITINVQDEAAPYVSGTLDGFQAMRTTLDGPLAYVASRDDGVTILDVSNIQEELSILSTIDTPGRAREVFAKDGMLYVADQNSGLQIIDATDPTQPVLIGSLPTFGASQSISVLDEIAYLADGNGGLRLVDVSDPQQPFERMKYPVTADAQYPTAITIADRTAYLGVNYSGMVTIALDDCPPCTVDMSQDGLLDFFDVQLFLQYFSAQDPRADFNADSLFDFFDVSEFLNQFAIGCP